MKKTKIALAATTLAIFSLMITTYYTEPTSTPISPQIRSASKAYSTILEAPYLSGFLLVLHKLKSDIAQPSNPFANRV